MENYGDMGPGAHQGQKSDNLREPLRRKINPVSNLALSVFYERCLACRKISTDRKEAKGFQKGLT
jgi:hypothetical protein